MLLWVYQGFLWRMRNISLHFISLRLCWHRHRHGDLSLHYTLNMCVHVCLSALCRDGWLDEVELMVFVVKGVQGSVMTSSWITLWAHSWPKPHHPVRTYHISLDKLWNYHFRLPLHENITTCLSSWATVRKDDGEKPSCAHACVSIGSSQYPL